MFLQGFPPTAEYVALTVWVFCCPNGGPLAPAPRQRQSRSDPCLARQGPSPPMERDSVATVWSHYGNDEGQLGDANPSFKDTGKVLISSTKMMTKNVCI